VGINKIAAAAATAKAILGLSGARDFPMPSKACATTATATIFNPCIQPLSKEPFVTNMANRTRRRTDGIVKQNQDNNPPNSPPRSIPIEIPTWELAGPGRNWHKATKSAYALSSNHFLFTTYSSRKYPRWAVGPPKEVSPSFVDAFKISA